MLSFKIENKFNHQKILFPLWPGKTYRRWISVSCFLKDASMAGKMPKFFCIGVNHNSGVPSNVQWHNVGSCFIKSISSTPCSERLCLASHDSTLANTHTHTHTYIHVLVCLEGGWIRKKGLPICLCLPVDVGRNNGLWVCLYRASE